MDQKSKILSTIDDMTNAFHKGDIDGIMRTYEAGAVVVGEPGTPVSGTPALRAMFAGFIAAKAQFTFLGHEMIQAEDIAGAWADTDVDAHAALVGELERAV